MISENDFKVKTLYFARSNYENFIRNLEKNLIQFGIVTFHENEEEEENENENEDIKNDDDNEEDDKKEVEEEKDNENQDDENI
jgi:hypothetical protein